MFKFLVLSFLSEIFSYYTHILWFQKKYLNYLYIKHFNYVKLKPLNIKKKFFKYIYINI